MKRLGTWTGTSCIHTFHFYHTNLFSSVTPLRPITYSYILYYNRRNLFFKKLQEKFRSHHPELKTSLCKLKAQPLPPSNNCSQNVK